MENIDPFPGWNEKDVTDYLWSKSTEIEPRNADAAQKKKITVRLRAGIKKAVLNFSFIRRRERFGGKV